MGGFVVTCVDAGYQNGLKEVFMILKMALFELKRKDSKDCKANPEREENIEEDIYEQLKKEREEMKKSDFVLLGGRRDSEILFIRNDTEFNVIDIYNVLIKNTTRAEYIRRIIPVKSIFTLSIDNLVENTKKVCEDIGTKESFRISLSKRLCAHISSEFIITKVAEGIPRKVDLKSPDKVVMVEIVKDLCGIGALKPCPGNFNITRSPRTQ